MHNQIFQRHQPFQVQPQLGIVPAQGFPDVAPAEAEFVPVQIPLLTPGFDPAVQLDQQPPGLGLEFIQRPSQHVIRQPVGQGNIIQGDFNVVPGLSGPVVGPDRSLVLVQKGNRPDQGQVFEMIAAGTGFVIQKGEFGCIGILHSQWTQ